MKARTIVLVILVMTILCLISSGCGQPKELKSNAFLDGIQVALHKEVDPDNSKKRKYRVRLFSEQGDPIQVEQVELWLVMKGMDHPPDEFKMKQIEEGVYEAELKLSMKGPWQEEVVLHDGEFGRKVTGSVLQKLRALP